MLKIFAISFLLVCVTFSCIDKKPDAKHVAWSTLGIPAELLDYAQKLLRRGYLREYRIFWDAVGSQYRVDFANPRTRHIVEFDGPSHDSPVRKQCDAMRDKRLEAKDWTVTRIKHK